MEHFVAPKLIVAQPCTMQTS